MRPIVLTEDNWYVRAYSFTQGLDSYSGLCRLNRMELNSCSLIRKMALFVLGMTILSVFSVMLAGLICTMVWFILRDWGLFLFWGKALGSWGAASLFVAGLGLGLFCLYHLDVIYRGFHRLILRVPTPKSVGFKLSDSTARNLDTIADLYRGWKGKYCQPVVCKNNEGEELHRYH